MTRFAEAGAAEQSSMNHLRAFLPIFGAGEDEEDAGDVDADEVEEGVCEDDDGRSLSVLS